jgi:NAD(P)-dependent dehydrogenase (short-subunit alcohol dehydrogenase family)
MGLIYSSQLEKAKNVANSINQSSGSAITIPGDMLDDAYLKTLVEKAAEFGNGKIHIIVNNAGYTWDGVIHKVYLPHSKKDLQCLPDGGRGWTASKAMNR